MSKIITIAKYIILLIALYISIIICISGFYILSVVVLGMIAYLAIHWSKE